MAFVVSLLVLRNCLALLLVVAAALQPTCHSQSSDPASCGRPAGTDMNTYAPWAPSNLAPFQIYWNANLCFCFNQTASCPPSYLNQTGLTVSANDTEQFCSPPCLSLQFNETLTCIYKVSRFNRTLVFKFTSGATVWQLNSTANAACANFSQGLPASFSGQHN